MTTRSLSLEEVLGAGSSPTRWADGDADPACATVPAALNSEQKALLDFLVLAKGKHFVGFGSSTFSFYLVRPQLSCSHQPSSLYPSSIRDCFRCILTY